MTKKSDATCFQGDYLSTMYRRGRFLGIFEKKTQETYKKANELVPFHVHIMYIEIMKIIFLFQTYLLKPFLLHIFMETKDLA